MDNNTPIETEPMRLEHVNLSVADLQRSVDFYRALFDFRILWRADTDAAKQEAHVGNDGFYLAFFQAARPDPADVDYESAGLNHFGIVVDDLEHYRTRLAELGVTPHHEPDYEPGRRFYFYDPDRIEVELVEYEWGTGT